jgi:hypothetical protein
MYSNSGGPADAADKEKSSEGRLKIARRFNAG